MKTLKNISPIPGLFLGILAVSTASIFIRYAQAEAPSLAIAAGRLSIATILLAPFVIRRSLVELRVIRGRTLFFMILGGIFLGFHFASWISSLEYTSVASSVVLVTTAPLWVALLSPLFLKEKVAKWVLIGLAISITGSMIVGISGKCIVTGVALRCVPFDSLFQGRAFFGNLLALLGAFLSGGYLMIGRRVRNELTLLPYTFIVYGIAAVVLIVLVFISDQSLIGYTTNTYIWILLLAIIPQLIGHSSFNYALKYLSAAYVSIALLGEPVGTILLAYLFLRESPTAFELFGGFLILLGITFATKTGKKMAIVSSK
ncbi:MAG: EamA family transporter [Anaerolinea sp.]|nr:EamA family transporter [Anaerolinea sp.]